MPFPLEYPAIAPFYSNIDTTNANSSTSISLAFLSDADSLQQADELIGSNFQNGYNFKTESVVVATWQNVGHFSENNDEQNTFQASRRIIKLVYENKTKTVSYWTLDFSK